MIYIWVASVIVWIAYAYFDTRFSYKHVDYHFASGLFTILVSALFPFALAFSETNALNVLKIFTLPFVILSIKWFVFDGFRNLWTKQNFFYIGSTAFMDGGYKGDNKYLAFLSASLRFFHFPLKVSFLILSFYLSYNY